MMELATVVLAAGLGTRMKSARAKVLHTIAGRPLIEYPVAQARALGSNRIVCVLGHQNQDVKATLERRFGERAVEIVLQSKQRGTGDAVKQAAGLLSQHNGLLLILYGDVPLITERALVRLVEAAGEKRFALMTARGDLDKARGYGRIVRDQAGRFLKIVEDKDCSQVERAISEINAGIYCGPARFIFEALAHLQPDNAQGELYLTDVAERAARELEVATIEVPLEEMMGVNDRVDLSRADRVMRLRLAEALMREGVTVRDPEHLYLEPGVEVGRDVELGPGVELRGRVSIGRGSRLEAGVIVIDSKLGEQVHIKPYCVITDSVVGDGAQVGPWAHLRPGSILEADVHLGNFVETKKTRMGKGSKANHLSYLGDADIGARTNVGCGTITCNYDGYVKSRTTVEEDVFIGSDTQLVAPVRIGRGAVIGAGTTVYEDVPPGALALTRTKQTTHEGYVEKKRARMAARPDGTKKGGSR
jgi:bifunctional UDP-N-acetylglucosamine pyrophosphorylase/glucosamine-1-phosphate N-acetyltransferase